MEHRYAPRGFFKNLAGKKFHKLTALFPSKSGGRSRSLMWRCRCECGAEVDIRADTLQKQSKSCGGPECFRAHSNPYPKKGDVYGMLTAVGYHSTNKNGGGVRWTFKCKCGSSVNIRWYKVRDGLIDHCGCQSLNKMVMSHKHYAVRTDAAVSDIIKSYRSGAKTRNLNCELTDEQFRFLLFSKCFYCGAVSSRVTKARKRKILHNEEVIKHNGVDRWDSGKGYSAENCVACCTTCNYAKRAMSGNEFIEWLYAASKNVIKLRENTEKIKKAAELSLSQLQK